MDDVTPLVAALQKSGFPLQARVAYEIRARASRGWKVLASEYPWRDSEGRDQFIDLIASCGSIVLVVECRKAAERALLFLRPLGGDTTGLVKTLAIWHVEQHQGAGKPFGSAPREIEIEPASYRTDICVSSDKSGQRLLEQEARPVVLAADAVVADAARIALPTRSFVVPVILTTAPLRTLRFEPTEVALDTGSFSNLDPTQMEPIQWVRFHKTLTARAAEPRTVLVVNTAALGRFLDEVSRGQGFGPSAT